MRNEMAKARMTKVERQFFAQQFAAVKAGTASESVKALWVYLAVNKTH